MENLCTSFLICKSKIALNDQSLKNKNDWPQEGQSLLSQQIFQMSKQHKIQKTNRLQFNNQFLFDKDYVLPISNIIEFSHELWEHFKYEK